LSSRASPQSGRVEGPAFSASALVPQPLSSRAERARGPATRGKRSRGTCISILRE
jgi:hypothetical protein